MSQFTQVARLRGTAYGRRLALIMVPLRVNGQFAVPACGQFVVPTPPLIFSG